MKFVSCFYFRKPRQSLPVRGAWIEMGLSARKSCTIACRSPCGERGLKSDMGISKNRESGRSPCGERGLKCRTHNAGSPRLTCRSPCGERGLKFSHCAANRSKVPCRSPCGERGLKCHPERRLSRQSNRRSPCGERGLKCVEPVHHAPHNSRSPCGERGLKYRYDGDDGDAQRRSPCGERGLKLSSRELQTITVASLPVRGAWIEIAKGNRLSDGHACRSPCGERGLKLLMDSEKQTFYIVAPRAGSVD